MHRKPWRVSELRVLTEGVRGALSPREICVPGRSESALRSMARKLKLVGDGVPRTQWTPEQKRLLTELTASGLKAAAIARQGHLPGFNRNAIQKQMQRMGLGHPKRSRAQKCASRFKGESLEVFHAFLNTNARCCTPMQIVQLWNEEYEPKVSHARVLYHLGILGLRISRDVVIKMAWSREKQRALTQQFVERERRRRQEQWLAEPGRLRKFADALRDQAARDGTVLQTRTCTECYEEWPARARFFHVMTKVTADEKRFYMARACRLCRNRKRRESHGMQAMHKQRLPDLRVDIGQPRAILRYSKGPAFWKEPAGSFSAS